MAIPLVAKRLLSSPPGLPSGSRTTRSGTVRTVGKSSLKSNGGIIVEDAAKFFAISAALKRSDLPGQ